MFIILVGMPYHTIMFRFFLYSQVDVTIDDINDNMPTFQQSTITRSLSEASVPGTTKLPLIPAIDNDSPIYAIVRYELIPENEFRLQVRYK